MKIRSVLFASAAGIMAVNGAYAADAVVEKAPVAANYVKICDTFGVGYFYIPGSDTCIKISGRIRAGVSYVHSSLAGASTASALADGRVAFSFAQATDLGKSESVIRFATTSSTSNSAVVDEAYIGVGDFSVGYDIKDTTITDYSSYGDQSFDIYGVDTTGSGTSFANGARLAANGWGVRADHDFGGGISATLGVNWAATQASQLLGAGGDKDAVVAGSVTYASGAIKGITLAAAYDTAHLDSTHGGWLIGAKGEYGVNDALSILGIAAYGDTTSAHNRNWELGLGAKYAFTPKLALYTDAAYMGRNNGYKNGAWVDVGAVYTIAKNLQVEAQEIYGNNNLNTTTTSYNEWTSFVRLTRNF